MQAAASVAALAVLAVSILCFITYELRVTQIFIFKFWPIGVIIVAIYTILSLIEDYLNEKLLTSYPELV